MKPHPGLSTLAGFAPSLVVAVLIWLVAPSSGVSRTIVTNQRPSQLSIVACPPPVVHCSTNENEFIAVAPCEQNRGQVTYPLPLVDNGAIMECTPPSGDYFPIGLTHVSCRATNNCGDIAGCSFMVTVQPPVVPCSTNLVRCPTNELTVAPSCVSNCTPIAYLLPQLSDGTRMVCNPPPGMCVPPFTGGGSILLTVTCRATNAGGVLEECSFKLRIVGDQSPIPRIDCPRGERWFTNQCNTPCTPVSYPLPYVAGGRIEGCTPPPGTCLPVGTHQVHCTAINACNTRNECLFEVRVVQGAFRLPTFGVPSIVLTNCSTNCLVVDYPLPVVPPGASIRCTPPPGTCFPVGRTEVVCVASNECGAFGNSFRIVNLQPVEVPMAIRVERQNGAFLLHWGHGCDDTGSLLTSREPDGPWEPVPGARPGYAVVPSEQKRYFRLLRD